MATEEPNPQEEKEKKEVEATIKEHVAQEEQSKKESEFYFRRFLRSLKTFLKRRLSIIDNADPSATAEGIEKDVEFRGFNLWILIFSIFICSIGLNTNSTAVIIGAMLISPLMGPIMGVGLAIGVNDIELLKRSLRNWGTAVAIAITSSTLYFFLTPLHGGESSELLARTTPTLLDVLVAIFGGATGILAGSRREKNNVIPGVAIATALMPPLCTAGYGIATGSLESFLGAIYLFLINSIFISLSTTLVVRYLKFPARKLPDPNKEKRVKTIVGVTLILFLIPSVYVFYKVVTETLYEQKVQLFITEEMIVDNAELVREKLTVEGESKTLKVVFFGEVIPETTIADWKREAVVRGLDDLEIIVSQGANQGNGNVDLDKIADVFLGNQSSLESKNQEIQRLRSEVNHLRSAGLPSTLVREIKEIYPEVADIYAGQIVQSSANSDTICTVFIKFDPEAGLSQTDHDKHISTISKWLETRGISDSVWVSELR